MSVVAMLDQLTRSEVTKDDCRTFLLFSFEIDIESFALPPARANPVLVKRFGPFKGNQNQDVSFSRRSSAPPVFRLNRNRHPDLLGDAVCTSLDVQNGLLVSLS